jgi:hypothetical protein
MISIKNKIIVAIIFIAIGAYFLKNRDQTQSQVLAVAPGSISIQPPTTARYLPAPLAKSQIQAKSKRLKALEEIINLKNDNDPRLDTDFQNLTALERSEFRGRCRELPSEKLNERGTIIFLLGQNLKNAEDLSFIAEVVEMPNCLSLENCEKDQGQQTGDHIASDVVTLSYPQLVALKALEKFLSESPSSQMRDVALQILDKSQKSENPLVAKYSQKISSKYHR